jgi:hypothetical protein
MMVSSLEMSSWTIASIFFEIFGISYNAESRSNFFEGVEVFENNTLAPNAVGARYEPRRWSVRNENNR